MSSNITRFKDKDGNDVYPLTSENAVRDANGVTLREKLAQRPTYTNEVDGESVPAFPYVEYAQQTLTDSQKKQARLNIGADKLVAGTGIQITETQDGEKRITSTGEQTYTGAADGISFNKSGTGLNSTNVQDAITEVDGKVTELDEEVEKLGFLVDGRNLIKQIQVEWLDGKYYAQSNSRLTINEGGIYTSFGLDQSHPVGIDISDFEGGVIRLERSGTNTSVRSCLVTDVNNNVLSYVRGSGFVVGDDGKYHAVLECKSGAKYLYLSSSAIQPITAVAELTNANPLISVVDSMNKSINDFNAVLSINNYFVKSSDGKLQYSEDAKCTDFIQTDGYRFVHFYNIGGSSSVASVAFYDVNKTYIPDLVIAGTETENEGIIDLNDVKYTNVHYIRQSFFLFNSGADLPVENFIGRYMSNLHIASRIKRLDDAKNLNVLIFGDSITDCAYISEGTALIEGISRPVTTSYRLLGSTGQSYAGGGTHAVWPHMFRHVMECRELRNYAQSGATYNTNSGDTSTYPRLNLYHQVELSINDMDNAGGAFRDSHFEPDVTIFAAGTNSGYADDTPTSALAKFVKVGNDIDIDATLNALDKSKFCEAVLWSFLSIRKHFPSTLGFCVLPIQRVSMDNFNANYRPYLRELAERMGFIIIDGASESGIIQAGNVTNDSGTTLKDGLHPNELGQKMMARMIISAVRSHYISFDDMV